MAGRTALQYNEGHGGFRHLTPASVNRPASTPEALARLNAALAGRYRIERELGQGGMATVYLARDVRHDRDVAIKVLRPELAAVLGAERFVVEIKTTAALQHPHILPLFDSGTADGFLFYVMPYIQGETIREKINRETQFGVDEAVRIAREVADALDYAHRHGVIHRDIKPENILLHDGRAMVMDFGIALAVSAAAGGRMTETGLSLGTPHYMSPEQATAEKEITGRSDVYSLASVLYEMLAGQPPHLGGSAQQIIMKIIAEPVQPVTALRKSVPPNVDSAIATALEKLPADRFPSARAFADALANPAFSAASTIGVAARTPAGRGISTRLFAATAAVAMLAIAGLVLSMQRSPASAPPPLIRFEVPLPDSLRVSKVALSPDGTRLLISTSNHGPFVYTFADARLAPLEIPGRAAITLVDVTPDGNTLVFLEGNVVKAMPMGGGAVRTIGNSVTTLRAGDDGYVYGRKFPGLRRFSLQTGVEEVVSLRDSARFSEDSLFGDFGEPIPVPGGRGVVFAISTYAPAAMQIFALDLRSHEITRVPHPETEAALPIGFTPSGHLLFRGTDGVYAMPFNTKTLRAEGSPERLVSGLHGSGLDCGGGTHCTGEAMNGQSLAYVALPQQTPALVTRRGVVRSLPSVPPRLQFYDAAASPDGRALVMQVEDNAANRLDLWTYRLPEGPLSRLISIGDGFLWAPRWTADGRSIRFSAVRKDGDALFSVPSDGSRPPEEFLRRAGGLYYSIAYSPDDRRLASVACIEPKSKSECGSRGNSLAVLTIGQPDSVLVVPGQRAQRGVFSPDGRWLAYTARDVD
ncbi:MAG: protein kinase domain-containing protein, partial [Gemmatimonadaceae bacterium]